ncbi:hypothetical protein HDU67_001114 [Dinochytrium kinnereticum]|nr:hypothetical protein HDU67_001114 [Dinochytrium kinnereticum]
MSSILLRTFASYTDFMLALSNNISYEDDGCDENDGLADDRFLFSRLDVKELTVELPSMDFMASDFIPTSDDKDLLPNLRRLSFTAPIPNAFLEALPVMYPNLRYLKLFNSDAECFTLPETLGNALRNLIHLKEVDLCAQWGEQAEENENPGQIELTYEGKPSLSPLAKATLRLFTDGVPGDRELEFIREVAGVFPNTPDVVLMKPLSKFYKGYENAYRPQFNFESGNHLVCCIRMFKDLQSFSIQRAHGVSNDQDSWIADLFSRHPHLSSLQIVNENAWEDTDVISISALASASRSMGSLRYLHLERVAFLNDEALDLISEGATGLQHGVFRKVDVSDAAWGRFIRRCHKLETLELEDTQFGEEARLAALESKAEVRVDGTLIRVQ